MAVDEEWFLVNQEAPMEAFLKATIMSSTFTAIMRLANYGGEIHPDRVSQPDFERQVAREVAEQATRLSQMSDRELETLRGAIFGHQT